MLQKSLLARVKERWEPEAGREEARLRVLRERKAAKSSCLCSRAVPVTSGKGADNEIERLLGSLLDSFLLVSSLVN